MPVAIAVAGSRGARLRVEELMHQVLPHALIPTALPVSLPSAVGRLRRVLAARPSMADGVDTAVSTG